MPYLCNRKRNKNKLNPKTRKGTEIMKTTVKVNDSRINRNNDVKGYMELCTELVQAQGYEKTFTYENNGSRMTYNEFKTTAYKQNSKDVQVDITLNFITGEATITVDAPEKSKLEEEMEQWEARANDEFGKTLKEINEKAFNEWFNEDDENGISQTPISYHITAYALDGNRKHTANVIRNIIEDYDMMEDVKELVKKMMKLAA